MKIVPALALLDQWLRDKDLTQTELAVRVGTTRQAVSSWIVGRVAPGLFYGLAIEEVTDGAVPLESWLDDDHKARLEKIAQRGAP